MPVVAGARFERAAAGLAGRLLERAARRLDSRARERRSRRKGTERLAVEPETLGGDLDVAREILASPPDAPLGPEGPLGGKVEPKGGQERSDGALLDPGLE
ncbi:MAG: hypothetical protein DMG07_18660, partial [Acidobacteria bacterium]